MRRWLQPHAAEVDEKDMLLDLIGLLLLAFFAAMGAWRGALASGAGVVGLVAGYAAAILTATRIAPTVAYQLGISPLIASLVAGSAAFFFVYASVAIAARIARKRIEEESVGMSGLDRAVGAGFGALRGGLVIVLVAWLATWVDAARDAGVAGFEAAPDTASSAVAKMSSSAIEAAVEAALSDAGSGSKVAARLAARPGASIEAVQGLVENPRLQEVQRDRYFWTLVENGASESALNRGTFYGIVHDEELRSQFSMLGLVSEAAAADPQAFRNEVRGVLDEVGPRIKGLKNDPEIQNLAQDPEIIAMLESGDTFGLMQHRGIRNLASRLAGEFESGRDS